MLSITKIKIALKGLAFLLFSATCYKAKSQCSASISSFPYTSGGLIVTFSSNNPVTIFSSAYEACSVTTPANSQWYGQGTYATTTGTYTFSQPQSNIVIAITAATSSATPAESFLFVTNSMGTTAATLGTYCFFTQTGNTITATNGNSCAYVTVSASKPFTTLSITHNQNVNNNGSLVSLCANSVSTLPVTLKNFTVAKQGNKSFITWTTSLESNIVYYQVQRSSDGKTFLPFEHVTNARNTSFEQTYTLMDSFPQKGNNYYRLKIVDADGKAKYSNICTVNFTNISSIVIYPNPANIKTELSGLEAGMRLQVIAVDGKIVKQDIAKGNTYLLFLADLPKGLYSIRVMASNGNFISSQKLLKH